MAVCCRRLSEQVSGRRSEIGFHDDREGAKEHEPELYEKFKNKNAFACYHQQSIENFETFAKEVGIGKKLTQTCSKALDYMYCAVPKKTKTTDWDRVHTCVPTPICTRTHTQTPPCNLVVCAFEAVRPDVLCSAACAAGSSMCSSSATIST